MTDTVTPNIGFTKPEVGASRDTWGAKTNANWDLADTLTKKSDFLAYQTTQDARDDAQDALIAGKVDSSIQTARDNAQDTAIAGKAPAVHTHPQSDVTNLVSDLALKAPIASPTFTGDPKAPTPATADNDTSIATTAYVKAQGYIGPDAPSDGTQYVRQNAAWSPVSVPPGTSCSDTPPGSPQPGQLWYETDTGNLYVYFNDGTSSQWVQVNGPAIAAPVDPVANCYLDWSGTNLLLRREQGTRLFINGVNETIPVSGVTLAATGLTMTGGINAGYCYYIYAYMNAGVMALEVSNVAPVVSNTHGMKVKSTDVTRTLVGIAALASAGNWWIGNACGVCSWFNPRWRKMATGLASQAVSTSLVSSGCYHYFAAFGDRQFQIAAFRRAASHTAAAQDHQFDCRVGPTQTGVWTSIFNGAVPYLNSRLSGAAGSSSQFFSATVLMDKMASSPIDGIYLAQIYVGTTSATATFSGLVVETMTWG